MSHSESNNAIYFFGLKNNGENMMSIQIQNYIVYLFVAFATIKLLLPLLELVYTKIQSIRGIITQEESLSNYADTCAHCSKKE
jgi:hypothetical protein